MSQGQGLETKEDLLRPHPDLKQVKEAQRMELGGQVGASKVRA